MEMEAAIIGRRKSSRLRLERPACLDLVVGLRRCVVLDMSQSGARIVLKCPPKPGEFGVLQIDSLDVFGLVVWSSSKACGFRFEEEIGERDILVFEQTPKTNLHKDKQGSIEFANEWTQGG
jgi:hypothetical protein